MEGGAMRKAFVIVVVACAALVLATSTALSQVGPTVTVTPDTGLVDGQTVTVQGSGFDPSVQTIGVAQCPFGGTVNDCIGQQVVPASGGSFTATFTVHRFALTVDCASMARRCYLGASNLDGLPVFTQQVFVPVTFAGATPATADDCRNGGWRNLADDQARPFNNQGQCVSFAVHVGNAP
jgi:hypothetical protein